jgi:hypothetical protein
LKKRKSLSSSFFAMLFCRSNCSGSDVPFPADIFSCPSKVTSPFSDIDCAFRHWKSGSGNECPSDAKTLQRNRVAPRTQGRVHRASAAPSR